MNESDGDKHHHAGDHITDLQVLEWEAWVVWEEAADHNALLAAHLIFWHLLQWNWSYSDFDEVEAMVKEVGVKHMKKRESIHRNSM